MNNLEKQFNVSFAVAMIVVIVLALLKIAGVVTSSWFWIAAPVWIPLVAILMFIAATVVVAILRAK